MAPTSALLTADGCSENQTTLDITLSKNYRSFEARAKLGRILGMFFLPFESAALVSMPPARDSETACHESKSAPAPSLPAAETPILLDSISHSNPAALVSFLAHSRRSSSPDVDEPFDAGQIPSNRYLAAPDLIGFQFEIPIALWPSIFNESRLELRS